jgi:enediyne biosynthesis protein E4
MISRIIALILCVAILGCKKNTKQFEKVNGSNSGITFRNDLKYDRNFNIYKYRNFYNGGGVAVGDVNNDGLQDVYFTSNMDKNKLYLNKGNFKFKDITTEAGVSGTKSWSTGVSMVDINSDGLMDIYVCNSGDIQGDDKENELFINKGLKNGVPIFEEKAYEYGLADKGFSTHASFFDYDKDGDLDMYLLNNSYRGIGSFNLSKNLKNTRDSLGGDKLFRNDKGKFNDVSAMAGIYGSVQGFGLGIMVGDVNKDGWEDIYVCNDFFEMDYLYINNKNGTFAEKGEEQFGHMSAASMGADLADINNDAFPDIFNTEMLPEDNHRLKQKTTFDNWNRFQYNLKSGYHKQFTHNCMQLNNQNGTWSDIAFMSGIAATDWSWGALIADYNNDGYKDIYIANGIAGDLTDQDYVNFISDDNTKRNMISDTGVNYAKLIDTIPSEKLPNYMYSNNGDLTFVNKANEWGLDIPSFSNGTAYADLDNDGDLDLIVNNVNDEAFLFKNNNEKTNNSNYLKIKCVAENTGNINAIGAKITLICGDKTYYQELMPYRGFQSSMDYRLNFGLGRDSVIDRIQVVFPNLKTTILRNVKANQILNLKQSDANIDYVTEEFDTNLTMFEQSDDLVKDIYHYENNYNEFDFERLIFHMNSTQGPKLAIGDVNGDGTEDVYICGSQGQAGQLLLNKNGKLNLHKSKEFENDKMYEDTNCTFFDADGDNDVDLYVVSGGSDGLPDYMDDRLYINNGKGDFIKKTDALPKGKPFVGTCIAYHDYDGDGDIDLFVGMQMIPKMYGLSISSFLLKNDGKANFTKVDVPEFKDLGMVKTATWADIDGDKKKELIVAGEWTSIQIFKSIDNTLKKIKIESLTKSTGWWNNIEVCDIDNDGDNDIIAANHGLNSRFKANEYHPIVMYVSDFDGNGSVEQLICQYEGDKLYPCVLRHDLTQQLPIMKKKYLEYKKYRDETIEKVLTPEQLSKAKKYIANTLSTTLFINEGKGKFKGQKLPYAAQNSVINGILVRDLNNDKKLDIILAGNFFDSKPETGCYDANYGTVLINKGNNIFDELKSSISNFKLKGQVRDIKSISANGTNYLLFAQNNDKLLTFKQKK